jgi:hypothetical protein
VPRGPDPVASTPGRLLSVPAASVAPSWLSAHLWLCGLTQNLVSESGGMETIVMTGLRESRSLPWRSLSVWLLPRPVLAHKSVYGLGPGGRISLVHGHRNHPRREADKLTLKGRETGLQTRQRGDDGVPSELLPRIPWTFLIADEDRGEGCADQGQHEEAHHHQEHRQRRTRIGCAAPPR